MSRVVIALAAGGLALAAAMPAAAVLPAGAPQERIASRERNDLDRRLPLQAGDLQRFDASRVAVSSSRLRAKATGGPSVRVTNNTDIVNNYLDCDPTPAVPGDCSLREAIQYVNNQCFVDPGPFTITFEIPAPNSTVISPTTQLPPITCDNTIVDGISQPGIVLDGTNVVLADFLYSAGLTIDADSVEVRGLSIIGMPSHGIESFTCSGSSHSIHTNILADNSGFGISIGNIECGADFTVIEANTVTLNGLGGISIGGTGFGPFAAASSAKARFEKGSLGVNSIVGNSVSGNFGPGLRIDGDWGTQIGSMTDPLAANDFRDNAGAGVEVIFGAGGQSFGINSTSGNSAGIGFDIGANGADANDTGDSAPPQNYPVLSTVTFDTSGDLMRLQGGLDTFNTGPFTVLLFGGTPGASYEAGPYLGQLSLPAGGPFDQSIPYDPGIPGHYAGVTANATSQALGAQSSEISALLSLPSVLQDKTSLAFGTVPVGGTATQAVTVFNAAGFTLLSATTTIPGVTVDASACAAPAGSSCVISVTFAPQVATPVSGTVEFVSNSAGLQRLAVSGSGGIFPLQVTWSASPSTVIAGNPLPLTLAIQNPNGATFIGAIGGFVFALPTGTPPARLVVPAGATVVDAAPPCAGTLVPATDGFSFTVSGLQVPAAGGSCSFTVDVTSTTPDTYDVLMGAGTINGLVLTESVANASSNTLPIVVSPVPAPLLVASPAPPGPIDFGSVTVGSSAFQTVTLTNAGNATLAFSGAPVTAAPFAVNTATATPCPSSLPPAPGPGNSCTVEVRFQPTAVGAASGTVAFASNGGSATLDLLGNGTELPVPGISLVPASIAFPPQAVGTTSSPVQVTLSSAGTAPLTINSIATTLGDFGLGSNCPIAPATLAAGGTCTISVTFAPLLEGDRIGTLTVASDAAQGTGTATLSGFGAPTPVPAVSVSSSSVSFPTTQVGTASEPLTLTVANAGGSPLAISAVEVVGAGFAVVSNGCVTPLPPAAECSVTLVFAPSATGTIAATLRILSNSPASPTFVGLSGTATAAPVATLSAQPAALDFGIREVDSTSPAQSVTLANTGGAAASISGVTVTGDFAQSNNCSLVQPGGSCTISVTFTPTATGTRAGSLVVAGDATNAPLAIALSGGGTPPPVPIIELSATSLSFGNSMIGRGTSQTVTVRNTGGAPLVITGLNVPFEFPVSNGCPASIPAGESCRLDVGFLPAVPGPRSGRVDILSNASNGTAGLGLSGTGCRFTFLGRSPALVCQ